MKEDSTIKNLIALLISLLTALMNHTTDTKINCTTDTDANTTTDLNWVDDGLDAPIQENENYFWIRVLETSTDENLVQKAIAELAKA